MPQLVIYLPADVIYVFGYVYWLLYPSADTPSGESPMSFKPSLSAFAMMGLPPLLERAALKLACCRRHGELIFRAADGVIYFTGTSVRIASMRRLHIAAGRRGSAFDIDADYILQ